MNRLVRALAVFCLTFVAIVTVMAQRRSEPSLPAPSPGAAPGFPASPVLVQITTTGFSAGSATIFAGAEVEWHNATALTQTLKIGEPYRLYMPIMLRDAGANARSASRWTPGVPAPLSASFMGGALAPGGTLGYVFPRAGTYTYFLGNAPEYTFAVIVEPAPATPTPSPPVLMAPTAVDGSVATNLGGAAAFLYSGTHAVQTGMVLGILAITRTAVLRGRVLTRNGAPLPSVTVTIVGHPEYGRTVSRSDGAYDLAVNGGGPVVLNYVLAGYLTAQRQVDVPWQDYVALPDVVLIQHDTQVTGVDTSGNSAAPQVAQGSVISDASGARQATVLFPAGTGAALTFAGGVTRTISSLSIRATEFTVGGSGPAAMPAQLPPVSGYTYAVALSADEADAAGATGITFTRPVYFYVNNFLGFQAGITVPVGYYDKGQGAWPASDSGLVIAILTTTNGLAQLDVDGSGHAASASQLAALGITTAEQQKLAGLYTAGASLWRVPLAHFSLIDLNCAWQVPGGATMPRQPLAKALRVDRHSSQGGYGNIDMENQIFGENAAIAGTPFYLHYNSDRTPGYTAGGMLNIPISGASVPANLKRIDLTVIVAGRTFTETFPAAPNQSYTFAWDGRDAYGRVLQGRQRATIKIGYVYNAVYQSTERFGDYGRGAITGSVARWEVTLWQSYRTPIGIWDARGLGLGGWSLSVQHVYDPVDGVLYLGDGRRRSTADMSAVIKRAAGTGGCGAYGGDGIPATQASLCLSGANGSVGFVAAGPDGSLYIADAGHERVRKVGPDGMITTVAGNGTTGFSGDGGPATQAQLHMPTGVAVGPDGSLYILDFYNWRIRKVGPDGIITTVAGNGTTAFSGDGGPATQAAIEMPLSIAAGPDGSLYIVGEENWVEYRVRRVGPDGIISTVAGNHTCGFSGDGGPAAQAQLCLPRGIAVGPDGSLYIADTYNDRVRKVSPDGIITTVAGNGTGIGNCNAPLGDGGPATQACVSPMDLAVGPDGSLYIGEGGKVRKVGPDGIITTIAGNGSNLYRAYPDGSPATGVSLIWPYSEAVGPDGSLYVVDQWPTSVYRVTLPLSFSGHAVVVPSQDGSQVYLFDASGRHLSTVNAFTGATIYQFGYDGSGHLVTVTDGDGNVTTIQRDASGNPLAVVSPYSQTTTLSLDANGYLAGVTNPAGEPTTFTYTSAGLMTSATGPGFHTYTFGYDASGRLTSAHDPAGGGTSLSRVATTNGFTVTAASALSRTSAYAVQRLSTGAQRRVTTFPDGARSQTTTGADASTTTTWPDGASSTLVPGPDPRFRMAAPIASSLDINTPAGLALRLTTQRAVSLTAPADPSSLAVLTDTFTRSGRPYTTTYDAATRVYTATTPMGRQRAVRIDSQGRVVGVQAAGFAPTSYVYDSRGRLASVTQGSGPAARTSTLGYDANGYLARVTDPLSETLSVVRDAVGRIVTQTWPDGRGIGYAYDASGNLISLTPPGRPAHTFTYTPLHLPSSYTAPGAGGGSTTQYAYNADRQVTSVTRPGGEAIQLGYDGAGRMVTATLPNGSLGLAYAPSTGNLSSITSPDGIRLSFGYDGALITGMTWTGLISGSVSGAYNNDFRAASISVNGGYTVNMGYDADGLLTSAGAITITRDVSTGLIVGAALGGVTDTASYNGFGEPASYRAAYSGAALYGAQYARDRLGRIVAMTETIHGASAAYGYRYDADGRLVGVTKDGSSVASYTYDANGNRLSYNGPGRAITATYDAQDRLLSYGAAVYTYTLSGELASRTDYSGTTSYQYDALGNLKAVTLTDGTKIAYLVDGQNRRVGKLVNGVLTQGFLYRDGLHPAAELDGSGHIASIFIYGSAYNVPDYMVKGGVTYRIIADNRDSPRLVVNAQTGQIMQEMGYDEFGRVITDTNPGFQPFGFGGGLYDPDTGLVRFGARDYDATAGRWTAKDPLRFATGDTNLYAYVGNDPLNTLDVTGLGPGQAEPPLADLIGGIVYHKGTFWVKNAGSNVWLRGYNNMPNYLGDKIRTGPGSRVTLEFNDGTQIGINQSTTVLIDTSATVQDITQRTFMQKLIIKLGTFWCKITRQDNTPFTVPTRGILLGGERG